MCMVVVQYGVWWSRGVEIVDSCWHVSLLPRRVGCTYKTDTRHSGMDLNFQNHLYKNSASKWVNSFIFSFPLPWTTEHVRMRRSQRAINSIDYSELTIMCFPTKTRKHTLLPNHKYQGLKTGNHAQMIL